MQPAAATAVAWAKSPSQSKAAQQPGSGSSLPRLRPPAVEAEAEDQRRVQPLHAHGGECGGAGAGRGTEPVSPRVVEVMREKPRSAMKGITGFSLGDVQELLQELGESGDMEVRGE